MPLDQTTQGKSGLAEVNGLMPASSQLRKRASTNAIREDELPQGAEHIQKRANTQTDQTIEIDDGIAMAQKNKENMEKGAEDKNSTKGYVKRKTRIRRTAWCCSCEKKRVVSKACECGDCGHELCAQCRRG